jgi:16S rRNA (cytosine1402-N4)-methyltransferase
MGEYHVPVLLQQVCTLLKVEPGKRYIDATLGGGGHAAAIIRLGGKVLGLDQDPDAIQACLSAEAFQPALASAKADPDLVLVQKNFIHLQEAAKEIGWTPVQGIIIDLGVSSHQISTPDRGFSFQLNGPLDMRMDPSLSVTAADLINVLSLKDLTKIMRDFGEVASAENLCRRIIAARPVKTTTQLARILPGPDVRRQVFQALRIAVNDELGALKEVLPQALSLLIPEGRLTVISFHSLEDRLVKKQFLTWENQGMGKILTPKPIQADVEEIMANPKSKSAKLRAFQKIL